MDRCDGCGFEYDAFARGEIADRVLKLADGLARCLSETPYAYASRRPAEGWSALEYGCHVRDVLRVQRERIALAQVEDEPEFVSMGGGAGRDQLAVDDRYNEQDPSVVAVDLLAAAQALVDELDGLDDAGWARGGTYTWPERAIRDVDWIARHTVHELEHHLDDVDRVLSGVLEG